MNVPSVQAIENWLANKKCTLWADWDITHDDSRHQAAVWLHCQLADLKSSQQPLDRMDPKLWNTIYSGASTPDLMTPTTNRIANV